MYLYYVASVRSNLKEVAVSYYAYKEGVYGLHLTSDINDPNILFYETEEAAKKHIFNANECVLCMLSDYVGKYEHKKVNC